MMLSLGTTWFQCFTCLLLCKSWCVHVVAAVTRELTRNRNIPQATRIAISSFDMVLRITGRSLLYNLPRLVFHRPSSSGWPRPAISSITTSRLLLRCVVMLPYVQTDLLVKGSLPQEKVDCRKKMSDLSEHLGGVISGYDDHTLVVLTWWLPQAIEIFALTRLALSSVSGALFL